MSRRVGARIAAFFAGVQHDLPSLVQMLRVGSEDTFLMSGRRYRVEVKVDPLRWMGLNFELLDAVGARCLNYEIDTDLYDISEPGQREFALGIEDDIVAFLDALVAGSVRVGQVKGKTVMVVPGATGFYRIERGRFLTSSKQFDRLDEALRGGELHCLGRD
ncbi:hypothetical protein [Micromonospora matsumotoense]|uniref:hypothetical protein n=1 Tax=Micromonospora matsumotoense TaxID=121616 RepID=UPI0033F6329D